MVTFARKHESNDGCCRCGRVTIDLEYAYGTHGGRARYCRDCLKEMKAERKPDGQRD